LVSSLLPKNITLPLQNCPVAEYSLDVRQVRGDVGGHGQRRVAVHGHLGG
jgi:hypothetical protein